MKLFKSLIKLLILFYASFATAQTASVDQFNLLIQSNHNFGLSNPLWNDANCSMTYIPGQISSNGAAFSFNFVNPGGNGFKGYPSGTVGGFKQGSNYSPGNVLACGLPVQINNLNHDLRIKWKVSQQNAWDADDKWWATINVIFDNTPPSFQPIQEDRDYDLVIEFDRYEQEDFNDVSSTTNQVYWYFARNIDNSLKTFDLQIDGALYSWAVRYKFFNYPVGHPDFDKNDKVHVKFIPIDNNNVAPYLDHSLKMFIETSLDYLQYVNLTPAELTLAQTKVADPNLWIKSISAGYEVYTGSFTVKNDYFYTILDNTPPSSPINLTAIEVSNGVNLNWDAIPDLDFNAYKIYRADNGGSFSLLAENIYTTNYLDATALTNNSYSYYIIAEDRSFNLSNPSNISTVSLIHLTPQQMVTKMGTGINLGNILSAPFEGDWAAPLNETYVDNVYRLRFKHVRIPIRFDNQTTPFSNVTYTDASGNYIGSPTDYSVNVAYLNRIEEILDWCLSRNLVAIIDVHGDKWFWESFDPSSPEYKTGNDRLAAIDRFKAIWRDISVRFQNKSGDVLYEIMNEPFFSMNAQEVIDINTQILSIIRQTNPDRNVIVTGGGQNSYNAPMQLTPAFLATDNHLIATFHYYRPFSFTSSASQQYSDNDWGSATDMATVDANFNDVQNWSLANNIPIYLGEFGADNVNGYDYSTGLNGNFGGPDIASRFLYHQYIANAARSRNFALSVWDAGEEAGKTIYLNSTESWVKDVRNAVLNSTCQSEFFINNSNIECNYDYNWTTSYTSGYSGKLNNSTPAEGYLNSVSLHQNVITSQDTFNGIIISNDEFTSNFIPGETYVINFKAKGNNNQLFKVRIKSITNGNTVNTNSASLTLTNQFTDYSYSYTVPIGTTSLTFQLLCGKDMGDYYFDEFSITSQSLTNENFASSNDIKIYPNPVDDYFTVDSGTDKVLEVILFSYEGKQIKIQNQDNLYFIENLPNGMYFVKIITENSQYFKSILIH